MGHAKSPPRLLPARGPTTVPRIIFREDTVSGRIDVHAHSMGPAYRTAIQAIGGVIRTPDWSPDLALKHMDRHGTMAGVLSLSTPG